VQNVGNFLPLDLSIRRLKPSIYIRRLKPSIYIDAQQRCALTAVNY
jgi:hypothetical protein